MQLSNEFKIRCSAIGKIMTEPKLKKDKDAGKLSATCLAYVHAWIKSQPEFYDRYKNFHSKYTLKGNDCEFESIKFAADFYGWKDALKNETSFENDYLTGTPDVILSDSVEDIKNSWSEETFPLFDTEIPIDGYGWQLQGYMELLNKDKSGLVYTLMDAPERLVMKEARGKAYELGIENGEVEFDLYEEVRLSMTYSHLRDDLRIKRFMLDRDKECMLPVQSKVQQIRDYIKSL